MQKQQEDYFAEMSAAMQQQQEEHAKLLADTKAAHAAVVEGHKQHLSAKEMAALEAKEAHEQALLEANPVPTRDEIRDALSGNYCRCTGYEAIVDAIDTTARDRAARTEAAK